MSGPYRDAGGFVPQETPPAPEPAREPIMTRINRACAEYMRRVCEMVGLPDDRMDAHALSLWQLVNRRTHPGCTV